MEQVQHYHQLLVQEEQQVQEVIALKGRKSLNDEAGVLIIPPSSFSLDTSGNGVCFVSGDETLPQKEDELIITSEKEEEEVEEMVNDFENGNHVDDNHAEVGVVGAVTNGKAIDSGTHNVAASLDMNSVFFDKQQGIWKCHHCSWTKRFDSPWNVPLGTLKGYSDLLMKVKFKTMIQHGPCFVYETKGIEFGGVKGVQNGDDSKHVDIQVENSDMKMKKNVDKVPCSPEISALQNSSQVKATKVENFGDKTLMQEIDQQLEELDVEAVLEKQETHDLFCPNCNSCITKRVILKKRKRNIIPLDTKAKRDKLDTKLVKNSEQKANQDEHEIVNSGFGTVEPIPADNHEPEREAEVFRCLSCFSFFIPLRKGFKLFPTFGGAREPETAQNHSIITPSSNLENPSIIAASKENWFFSLFASNDRKKARGQGDSCVENPRLGPAYHHHSSSPTTSNVLTSIQIDNSEDQISATAISKSTKPTPETNSSSAKSETIGSHMETSTNFSEPPGEKPLPDQKSIDSLFQDDLLPIQPLKQNFNDVMMNEEPKIGIDFFDIPAKEKPINDDVRINVGEKRNDPEDLTKKGVQEEPQSPVESLGSEVLANDGPIPPNQDFSYGPKDIEEEIKDSVIEVNQEPSKSSTSQIEDDVPNKGTTATETYTQIDIGEQPSAETVETQNWEIVKSIVYGGLIESITSLGIVSSASSSGATPLNIIALGLANLIGGLFIIGHDLIELKNDTSEETETNTQEDRYQEILGRRANFLLHAVVAVLSFVIFGSVPIVVYGLLIRESYSAEVKILVVAAISLVCIILLAIGKAYTKRSPKSYIKTVLKYVTMAVATSGVSYIAGELIKDLLEKFMSQDSSLLVLNMPFSRTARIEPALMSY